MFDLLVGGWYDFTVCYDKWKVSPTKCRRSKDS